MQNLPTHELTQQYNSQILYPPNPSNTCLQCAFLWLCCAVCLENSCSLSWMPVASKLFALLSTRPWPLQTSQRPLKLFWQALQGTHPHVPLLVGHWATPGRLRQCIIYPPNKMQPTKYIQPQQNATNGSFQIKMFCRELVLLVIMP